MNRSALQIKYNDPGSGLFKDNTTKDISEQDLRDFVEDMSNNALTIDDNKYNGVKGTSPGINTITALKAIATVNNGITPVTTCIAFRDTDDSQFRFYELVAGTDAESLPNIVQPNDFNATTNQKVWKLAPAGIDLSDYHADQIFMTANQWAALSSDSNMYMSMDIDSQLVELGNQSNYLRITDFDIELGAPLLGYSTTSQMQAYVNTQLDSQNRVKFVKGRTTAALPACTANAGFTTLTCNSNQAFSGLTTETDGLTYGLLQDILVMNESDQKRWGIYQLSVPGSISTPWVLTRRADANPGTDLTNMIVLIEQGTRFKNTSWRQTTLNPVFGTDNLNFVPFADGIRQDSSGGYWRIDVSTLGVLSTTSI